MFAVQDLAEGETLIEYVGEIISWKEALRRHPHDPTDPNHTFYFHVDASSSRRCATSRPAKSCFTTTA